MKIFVAIPTYDCKIHMVTSRALIQEQQVATALGHEMTVCYQPGMSLVHAARNLLVWEFFRCKNKPDVLVFVDADTGWVPGTICMLANHKHDVVAAAVPRRRDPEDYAMHWLDEPVDQLPDGCIEIKCIGMALTAIKREALERFRDATPELAYDRESIPLHGYFESPIRGNRLLGEDYAFCEKWRALGGKVYVDPRFPTIHAEGLREYHGLLGKWLNDNAKLAEDAAKASA